MGIREKLSLKEYLYELPEDRIAKYPLKVRDASKLLFYHKGEITHENFYNISNYLPGGATLFFNNTRVIPARLLFEKSTGAAIEIFLLQPVAPTSEIALAMQAHHKASWKCMVRNLKKWKNDEVLIGAAKATRHGYLENLTIKATIEDPKQQIISFEWNNELTFAEMVNLLGEVPLPPYLKRKAETADRDSYQTIYSLNEGAVAAPTAGLHFTPQVLDNLAKKGITSEFLTLHVSAGTFQPIKEDNVIQHPMHSEQIIITLGNIDAILRSDKVIAVGTTSMRTLESLYWFGVQLYLGRATNFKIEKLTPYDYTEDILPNRKDALQAIIEHMEQHNIQVLSGSTEIFIFPGYKFRICQGLVTNFHQPGSTLILLVAAFIGKDWRKLYNIALEKNYRFLSYGDSSLLLPYEEN